MPVQSHIHLSDTIGEAPELAPTYKWKATERIIVPQFNVDIVDSLIGTRFDFAIENVVYHDMVYDLLLHDDSGGTALQKLDVLLGLAGKRLWLVDHVHVNNGEDHTPDVKLVRMSKMGEIPQAQLGLQIFQIQIYLSKLNANS